MAAKAVFKWSKKLTTSQVQQLIRAEKDVNKALRIFDSATAEYSNGYKHDHSTFHIMISKLLSVNQFKPAEEMLNRMKMEKCEITEEILLSVCRAYGRVHRSVDVVRIFRMMEDEYGCKPTERSFITVLSVLVDESQLKEAFGFYRYMKEMGIRPSVVSLNILIKALCKNGDTVDAALKIFLEMPSRGCVPDLYTYGTLINGLCKLGRISEGKDLFQEMEGKGCLPSVVTYTSLIHGLCQSEKVDEAMNLFEKMKSNKVEPNVFTFSCLMDGLCKAGRSRQAFELLGLMVGKRLQPNTITYSTLITGLCKEGKLSEAVELLDRMKLQGLKPDAGLYGRVIIEFSAVRRFQEAANFLDEMVLGGVKPSRLTWSLHVRINNMVVKGLAANGDLNRAFRLYLSMRTRGISVEAETSHELAKIFVDKGDLQKAARVVDGMVADGCVPDEGLWNIMMGGFWDRRKACEAFESLFIDEIGYCDD
ncbi:Pentatricopeptide repeat-containing protein At5g46100 [Linum grandiflorum]